VFATDTGWMNNQLLNFLFIMIKNNVEEN